MTKDSTTVWALYRNLLAEEEYLQAGMLVEIYNDPDMKAHWKELKESPFIRFFSMIHSQDSNEIHLFCGRQDMVNFFNEQLEKRQEVQTWYWARFNKKPEELTQVELRRSIEEIAMAENSLPGIFPSDGSMVDTHYYIYHEDYKPREILNNS